MLINNNKTKNWVAIGFAVMTTLGCKKLVEVPAPYTSISAANVYTTDATSIAVLTGIYAKLSGASFGSVGLQSMSFYGGLSADELTLYSGVVNTTDIASYTNSLTALNALDIWGNTYPYIFQTNAAIEGISASGSLTQAVKQQLIGEAEFMRAFFYFYLVTLYGDVPLVLSTDYTQTATLPRTAKALVFRQIIADLKDAQSRLDSIYVDATVLKTTTERTRPNKWVATALLARAYLYTADYANAEAQATNVINNSGLFSLSTLNNAFLRASAGNKEAIWQWQPVTAGYNTQDARLFIIPSTGLSLNSNPVYLSKGFVGSFEVGDQRRANWVDSVVASGIKYYYPYKYKINAINAAVTEYEMVFRLGEQYLIRAEARAQQDELSAAASDLNVIRNRAGLANITYISQADLLTATLKERRVELFTEWGHRWLDLKRTGSVDSVMGVDGACQAKGGTWNTNWQLYPITLAELQGNPFLSQNTGY